MNKKERVLSAINHTKPDYIPYSMGFSAQILDDLIAATNDKDFYQSVGNNIDAVDCLGEILEIEDKPGYFKDDYGVIWNRNGADKDIGVIDDVIINVPNMELFPNIEIDLPAFKRRIENMISSSNDTFKMCSIGFSMFERAWSLVGMEDLLCYMVTDEKFVHNLFDRICDINLSLIDIAMEYPIDGFYFGDDWGQQKGLIMGPNFWRTYIKPRMAKMYKKVKEGNKSVIQHSCGDIIEIFPDLIEIGLDVYQTFQPEIYDIEKVKKDFGDKLTFWGGISTQRLLPFATADKVKTETIRIMKIMSINGGFIAGPTHSIPFDVPVQNVLAMLEVFKNQDIYL